MFVILLTANFKFRNRSTCSKGPMKRAGKVYGDSQDLKSPGITKQLHFSYLEDILIKESKNNDIWAVGKCSNVVIKILCCHKKIIVRLLLPLLEQPIKFPLIFASDCFSSFQQTLLQHQLKLQLLHRPMHQSEGDLASY